MLLYFYLICSLVLLLSLAVNLQKTLKALKIAGKKLLAIIPSLMVMVILVSIILYIIPDTMIRDLLGSENKYFGLIIASMLGSITLMPGFVAFPLAGILLSQGVPYMILSSFTTTMMMVGILTFPLEQKCFGTKVTIIRNSLAFLIAIAVALITGICFGELF